MITHLCIESCLFCECEIVMYWGFEIVSLCLCLCL